MQVADNIHELVALLKATHQPGDLYRGQNSDYPVMLPSFFRNISKDMSSADPITEVDSGRFDLLSKENTRFKLRFRFLNHIIGDFGVGLGNILAQQYGLGSETIDVTTDIDVAAYFATRRYPTYAHVATGQGVIYRFRQLESDGLTQPFRLTDLSNHFEMGKSADGFFDFFVNESNKSNVFDRERWWTFDPGREADVCTLRFVSDHAALRAAAEHTIKDIISDNTYYKGAYNYPFDWEKSRFFAQSGGLIRPRIYWRSLVPVSFELAVDSREAYCKRRPHTIGPFIGDYYANQPIRKFPLVLPSAAIKKEILGVENLRADPACEPFFFQHSEQRLTGFYRRELWPEPSEDAIYAALWQLGISVFYQQYGWGMPPVDDALRGILDRGYYVSDEVMAQDGREETELLRGQIEDARENQLFGNPGWRDFFYEVSPLINLGNYHEAALAAIQGLRKAKDHPDLLLSLITCFEHLDKTGWAEQLLERVLLLAPEHVYALYLKSVALTRKGKFEQAIGILHITRELFDQNPTSLDEYFLIELDAILACVTGDAAKLGQLTDKLSSNGYEATELASQVAYLLEKFPEQRAKAVPI